MKKQIIAIVALVMALSVKGQNLIDTKWKFTTGDDSLWAAVNYDDSKWVNALMGDNWENWGFKDYDGFAWYRKSVVIPSRYKKQADQYGGFTLTLDRIDDVDFTWFNGKLIGHTGSLPPNYQSRWDVYREYTIPSGLILWDKPNVIAVRVFDKDGAGGMYGENISLMARGVEKMVFLKPALKEPDRILHGITDYLLPVDIENGSTSKIKGKLKVVILRDLTDTFAVKEVLFEVQPKTSHVSKIELKGLKPCIYLVHASIESDLVSKILKFNFAVDPEKLISSPDNQPDFINYWARAKRELAAVDPQYKLTKMDKLSTAIKDCYLVEMRSLGNVLIRGWYMVPKKPGKYPAILTVQGYSTNMQPDWTYPGDDMISFGLNIRGHGNSTDNINPGFPGYLTWQIRDKEQFIYRGAYMDCVRAVDFLFSRPEIDTNRVAIEGGSQGGALSFATEALVGNRIKAVVSAVPFLSDFREYIKVGKWPANEWFNYAKEHPEFGIEGELKTLSYFDIKNLAPWITAPVFMAVGLMDVTCPPRINFAAYNNLKVQRKYLVYQESGHAIPAEFNELKYQFLKEMLGVK